VRPAREAADVWWGGGRDDGSRVDDNGGATDDNGGATDDNGGATDGNGGATDPDDNGGATDDDGGGTDNANAGIEDDAGGEKDGANSGTKDDDNGDGKVDAKDGPGMIDDAVDGVKEEVDGATWNDVRARWSWKRVLEYIFDLVGTYLVNRRWHFLWRKRIWNWSGVASGWFIGNKYRACRGCFQYRYCHIKRPRTRSIFIVIQSTCSLRIGIICPRTTEAWMAMCRWRKNKCHRIVELETARLKVLYIQ
jgi:hypothetical protein